MITRLLNLWNRIRSSLWFIPMWMSAASFALALGAQRADRLLATTSQPWLRPLVYSGDIEGTRTLLATLAGSMITVAGTTFSVTVVALSLASSQFGPRLLVSFMRDRGNQFVLGTFISTFLYCLVSLGIGGTETGVLPTVSTSIGLLLALASVGVLIYFIHHVASAIRAEHVVNLVARDVAGAIDRLFPPDESAEAARPPVMPADLGLDDARSDEVPARTTGYIQAIDEAGLVAVAGRIEGVIRMLRRPGHFVIEGEPLATVIPAGRLDDDGTLQIQRRVLVGRSRTDEQDPEYGIHQLVEVAVRALSPGVNDPHTAISCIDWLSSILHRVARRRLRSPARHDAEGALRLVNDPVTFEGLLEASFDQIRQCAYSTPAVSIRMLEALASIGAAVDDPARGAAVLEQADTLLAGSQKAGLQEADRRDLEERHRAVAEAVKG